MRRDRRYTSPAFTLIELLVVVAIIALLIAILLPSLHRARQQTKSVVCLSNLKSLGQGVLTFASEETDRLPGHLHPAVYRNQGTKALMENPIRPVSYSRARFLQERQITFQLRRVFHDSDASAGSVTDEVSTCPALAHINSDSAFEDFYRNSAPQRYVYPTHYVINNVGETDEQGPPIGGMRTTEPAQYFGYSPHTANVPELEALARRFPPQKLTKIERPAEEWMIADAWYRKASNTMFPELQQEGPYQWNWSGEALPNFAPHFSGMVYDFISPAERNAQSIRIREGRDDGETNTVFFDGHAKAVESKTLTYGTWVLLYGFPGTVNPRTPMPDEAVWK